MSKKRYYKPRDWKSYNQSKVDEGNIFIHFGEDMSSWWYEQERNGHKGRDRRYSEKAIEVGLILKSLFRQGYRQLEGFLGGILQKVNPELSAPDSTTLCRRSQGMTVNYRYCDPKDNLHIVLDSSGVSIHKGQEWNQIKHRKKDNKKWIKCHIAIDAKDGEIVATQVTGPCEADSSQVAALLAHVPDLLECFYADGGYDRHGTYAAINAHQALPVDILIPPIKTSVLPENTKIPLNQRQRHIDYINTKGRMRWESKTRYHRRNKVEGTFARFKAIFGESLLSRNVATQNTEINIKAKILNYFNQCYTAGFVRAT